MQNVLHIGPSFHGLGGIESTLNFHYKHDSNFGLNSKTAIFLEKGESTESVFFLRKSICDPLFLIRERLKNLPKRETTVAIYHNPYNVQAFASCDNSARRICLVHAYMDDFHPRIAVTSKYFDAIWCVSPALAHEVHIANPEYPTNRIHSICLPICTPKYRNSCSPRKDVPLRLGYVGRIIRPVKRVDRSIELIHSLKRKGLNFTFDYIGDGPFLSELKQRFPNDPQIRFRGRLCGEEYFSALRSLDVITFFSESEGLPLSLLEALSFGVLPLFPDIQSEGKVYTNAISPFLVYTSGQLDELVRAIERVISLPAEELHDYKKRGLRLISAHTADSYMNKFTQLIQEQILAPRISQSTNEFSGILSTLPLFALSRVERLFLKNQTFGPLNMCY